MKVQVVKLIWKKKSSEAKHRRKIFTSILIRIVSDRLSVIIKQYSWPGYLDFHDSRRRIHRGNEGNSFAYSPCRPRRSKTLTCAPIRQCLYPRMCARWRNTSGGMTWAKTRIEMCFFSRRLPTRNYTRVPLSSTLAFFLSLVEFALALQRESELRPNDSYDHDGRDGGWFMERGCLLFFLTITLRRAK